MRQRRNVSFLPHAVERMLERELDSSLVLDIAENPQQLLEEEEVKIAQRRYFDGEARKEYLIRVFFKEQEGEKIIVSAYRTSKVQKYWKEESL